jgi:hypothetical protein
MKPLSLEGFMGLLVAHIIGTATSAVHFAGIPM